MFDIIIGIIIIAIFILIIYYNFFLIEVSEYFLTQKFKRHTHHLGKKVFKSFFLLCSKPKEDITHDLKTDLIEAVSNLMEKIKSGDNIIVKTHLISEKYSHRIPFNPIVTEIHVSILTRLRIVSTAILAHVIRKHIFHKKSKINIKKLYNRKWYCITWTKKITDPRCY